MTCYQRTGGSGSPVHMFETLGRGGGGGGMEVEEEGREEGGGEMREKEKFLPSYPT